MKRLLYLLIIPIFILPVYAGDIIDLRLDDCIKMGLENNHVLRSNRFAVEAANAKVKEKKSDQLPELTFTGAYARLSEIPPFTLETGFPPPFPGEITISDAILDYYSLKLTVRQPLFTGFRLSNLHKMSNLEAKSAQYGFSAEENNLVMEIEKSFWEIFKLEEYRKVFTENIRQLEAHLKDVENFYEEGLITRDNVLQVQSSLSSARVLEMRAEDSVEMAKLYLKSLIGMDIRQSCNIIAEPVEDEADILSVADAVTIALENRAELKSMQMKAESALAGIKAVESSYYPQIFLSGNYYYDKPNQRIMPTVNEFRETWDIGVGMSVSIWNWGRTSQQKQQAYTIYKQTLEMQEALKDKVRLEVNQSQQELRQAEQRIKSSQDAVDYAEESYKIIQNRYREGAAISSELLDAEVLMLKAKTDLAATIADHQISIAKYERAIGIKAD